MAVSRPRLEVFACGDNCQAVLWLMRRDTIGASGMLERGAAPITARVRVPNLAHGRYRITPWDTVSGAIAALRGRNE
jgi:mannan endo-1,4-beta-mannosidase